MIFIIIYLFVEKADSISVSARSPNGNFYTGGTIEFAPQPALARAYSMAQLMQDKFKLPVTLTNDANAAAIGEMINGAAGA